MRFHPVEPLRNIPFLKNSNLRGSTLHTYFMLESVLFSESIFTALFQEEDRLKLCFYNSIHILNAFQLSLSFLSFLPLQPTLFPDSWLLVLFHHTLNLSRTILYDLWIGSIHWYLVGSPVGIRLKAMTVSSLNPLLANSSWVKGRALSVPLPSVPDLGWAHYCAAQGRPPTAAVDLYLDSVLARRWDFTALFQFSGS